MAFRFSIPAFAAFHKLHACTAVSYTHLDVYKRQVLACGVSKAKPVPGEAELLGRGVSYCATCDGMLYRCLLYTSRCV